MKCQKVSDLLKADYLDGELSAGLHKEIERHLEHCPSCQLLKQELDSQRLDLRSLKEQEVPAGIWQNIQKTILQEELGQQKDVFIYAREGLRRFFYPSRPAFVLATGLAVLMVIFFLGKAILSPRGNFNTASAEDFLKDYQLNGFTETSSFGTAIEDYFL